MVEKIILLPELFPSINRYNLIFRKEGKVAVCSDPRFNKRQKQVHRYTIADANGTISLTVPVEKPAHSLDAGWNDVGISRHGQWWNIHRTALESAYSRTPFFEFYIDRLLPFISSDTPDRFRSVAELAIESERTVLKALGLEPLSETEEPVNHIVTPEVAPAPYWQVRQDRFGFIPGMSILDLLFNLGPEAPLYLRRAADASEGK